MFGKYLNILFIFLDLKVINSLLSHLKIIFLCYQHANILNYIAFTKDTIWKCHSKGAVAIFHWAPSWGSYSSDTLEYLAFYTIPFTILYTNKDSRKTTNLGMKYKWVKCSASVFSLIKWGYHPYTKRLGFRCSTICWLGILHMLINTAHIYLWWNDWEGHTTTV